MLQTAHINIELLDPPSYEKQLSQHKQRRVFSMQLESILIFIRQMTMLR